MEYREVMALKRQVVLQLSRCFFDEGGAGRKKAFDEYVRAHPEVEGYAAFRGRVEATGADWRRWPGDRPEGCRGVRPSSRLTPGASEVERYHLFCQWQMEEQLARLADRGSPPGLFLDLPVGVHPGGFDTWRWPELFVSAMSAGAPPDSFFARGQNWACPPLHPQRMRERGHQYFANCVRHQMRHARYLRIDHVMSLHRLFWVPSGSEPAGGVYVTYPAEELYAVLSLESHRNHTVVVGEDLGTVPAGVRSGMRRHGVLGTWVLQSSLRPRAALPVGRVPRQAVAGLNTHDMFPFAGFLRGDDIVARMETGQVDLNRARRELGARAVQVARLGSDLPTCRTTGPVAATETAVAGSEPVDAELLCRVLVYLARSRAFLFVVSLDDLLHETRPQNLPGTGTDWGNWRHKIAGSEGDVRRAVIRIAKSLSEEGALPTGSAGRRGSGP